MMMQLMIAYSIKAMCNNKELTGSQTQLS